MWFLIIGAFFAAVVAIGWFAVQEGGDRFGDSAPAEEVTSTPRAVTSDQAVFEIEHRIHDDLREITHAVRGPPGRFQGVLRA